MVDITISGGLNARAVTPSPQTNPSQVGKRLLVASGMESAELDEYVDMALNLSDQCMSLKVPLPVPWWCHGRAMVPGGYPPTGRHGIYEAHGILGEISGRNLKNLFLMLKPRICLNPHAVLTRAFF